MKKVLILGGTSFIGRNLVEGLMEQGGFDLTLFNRGRTGGSLFPGVKRIIGDRRTKDIEQFANMDWDFVVDLSCYFPKDLEKVLRKLHRKPERYIFISTCSVYDFRDTTVLRDETAAIIGCNRTQFADASPGTYGNRKAECERILARSGLDHVIFRPALVYGPHDPTDRLYYWLHQVKHKEELLLPDKGERRFSVTYVHDLTKSIVWSMDHQPRSSVYNVITIPEVTIGAIVKETCALLGRSIPSINMTPEFLKRNGVRPWVDLPLWLNGDNFTYSNERIKNEMAFAPSDLDRSLNETLAYYSDRGWPEPNYGMSEAQRGDLLDKYYRSEG